MICHVCEKAWRSYLDAPAHQRFADEVVDPVSGSGSVQIQAADI
jgi:hypothetical protein